MFENATKFENRLLEENAKLKKQVEDAICKLENYMEYADALKEENKTLMEDKNFLQGYCKHIRKEVFKLEEDNKELRATIDCLRYEIEQQ